MGRIFTWEQISNRQVPQLGDFDVVVDHLRKALEREQGIAGAILCGSVFKRQHNQRSDIDCVAVYDVADAEVIFKTFQELSLFSRKLFIPLNIIPVDLWVANSQLHNISWGFGFHLVGCVKKHEDLIKGNIIHYLKMGRWDRAAEVKDYLAARLDKLGKGLAQMDAMDNTALCKFLQLVVETPKNVVRKVVQVKQNLVRDLEWNSYESVYITMADAVCMRLLNEILGADRDYTNQLSMVLERLDRVHYEGQLRSLRWRAIDAYRFVRLNMELLK